MRKCITPERVERIRQVLSKRQKDLSLVIDNVWDPHNVSAILRSCDAFGVLNVHLYYTEATFPELGKKSSGSAKKWIGRVRHKDAGSMVDNLAGAGYQLIRTGFSETAKPLQEVDFTRPTAVVLGNEHRGVTGELAELIPQECYIPMVGMVQSFNVSVAAAIILYEAFSQRMRAGFYDEMNLSPQEYELLVKEWMQR